MHLKTKLEEILGKYPEVESVEVSEDGKLATITSKSFEGVGEAERQAKVWGYLSEHIPEDQLYRIEFVFTDTPAEHAAAA